MKTNDKTGKVKRIKRIYIKSSNKEQQIMKKEKMKQKWKKMGQQLREENKSSDSLWLKLLIFISRALSFSTTLWTANNDWFRDFEVIFRFDAIIIVLKYKCVIRTKQLGRKKNMPVKTRFWHEKS